VSKWVTRGKASVMHLDIEVTVLIKEQFDEAIRWLVERHFNFEFDVVEGDSLTPTTYHLRIPDMCWANNLKEFSEVLIKSDYKSDEEGE
jgi:hypothetical protein